MFRPNPDFADKAFIFCAKLLANLCGLFLILHFVLIGGFFVMILPILAGISLAILLILLSVSVIMLLLAINKV